VRISARSVPSEPSSGVNLVGFLDAEFGLGEAARRVGRGLEHAGVAISAITYRQTPVRQQHAHAWRDEGVALYDTNVLCLQPDQLEPFALDVGADFFANRLNIGLWFWETSVFPATFRGALRLLDCVWVTSDYVRRVLDPTGELPVRLVPLPVLEPNRPAIGRAELGIPDGFVFLVLFDFVSAPRKNPWAAVEAFIRAFEPDDGAVLLLKSINGRERKPKLLEELERATADRRDIRIVDGYVSAAERDAFVASCDCLVSLHRAEGLGLPLLEAMTLAKPVIATAFSGNLAFMDDASGYLVPFRLVSVPTGVWGHAPGAEWAEPDVESAAAAMRNVFENPEEARARGLLARQKVCSEFSLERAGAMLLDELECLRTARSTASLARRRSLVEVSLTLARRQAAAPGARGPRSLVRNVVLQALWPQLEAQRRHDDAMLDLLAGLERSLARLERRLGEQGEVR
jgi:glycosyltransferase involved in cell wall biosynthesis